MKNPYVDELLNLFNKKGGYYNKKLAIKKNDTKGFYIEAQSRIKTNELLIEVPNDLLINVKNIQNLKKPSNKYEEIYFKTLIQNNYNFKIHPYNSNATEQKIIFETIYRNKKIYLDFFNKINKFKTLNLDEKLIELFKVTRAIKFNNESYFMPILDFVNYDCRGERYQISSKGNVYIQSQKDIGEGEEILINYGYHNAILFYLNQGFITNSFNSFKIGNEFKIKKNSNLIYKKKFFYEENNMFFFKENVIFENNQISKNYKKFLSIFPEKQRSSILSKILILYKKSIIIDLINSNELINSVIIKNFKKSVELYLNIINNYISLIKKNEKN